MGNANLYDVLDPVLRGAQPRCEPGRNLQWIYKETVGNFFLRHLLLRSCRHPGIPRGEVTTYQAVFRAAFDATPEQWADPQWTDRTFQPIAALLDGVENPRWQHRVPVHGRSPQPGRSEIEAVLAATLKDITRVWGRDGKDPYFPVAAHLVLTGDDHMDGENFLDVLRGLGGYEYKNITVLFSFARCFLMANPRKRDFIRRRYRGVSETMRHRVAWIWHRAAFYDVFFFEHLLNRLTSGDVTEGERRQAVGILENIVRFVVRDSVEELVSPNNGIRFPAVTCLPKGEGDLPLCRLSRRDWERKRLLGFGEYVPDTDTTFISLAMARRWLDHVDAQGLDVDESLLRDCEAFLAHPWVGIVGELQQGGPDDSNPPTIRITKPLDYHGAVPIWFDKPMAREGGRTVREVLGNEICPGHNMDILESILLNRRQWKALNGENLEVVHRLLEFHHHAFVGGNFKAESAYAYYLPEIYTYYTARFYDTYLALDDDEKKVFDPDGKVEAIRAAAIDYVTNDLVGSTLNPLDAALAVSALVLLRYPEKDDGVVATALQPILRGLGEGRRGHPYKPYEWNRMRHPTRIVVGSDVTTSFFVMNACVDAMRFLYGRDSPE